MNSNRQSDRSADRTDRLGDRTVLWIAGIVGAAIIIWILLAILPTPADQNPQANSGNTSNVSNVSGATPGTPDTGALAATPVASIFSDPSAFEGRKVAVRGDVMPPTSARAFILDESGIPADGADQILVVTPQGTAFQVADSVVVTGTIVRTTVAAVERQLDTTLAPEIRVKIERLPIIMADTVVVQ